MAQKNSELFCFGKFSMRCCLATRSFARKKVVTGSNTNSSPKSSALASALAQIQASYGAGSIMSLSGPFPPVNAVSTGSLALDLALGPHVMGLAKGRVVEIYGPESSGKTTLALMTMAQEMAKGGKCVFVDAEHALDINYAQKLGVKIEDLIVSQPDSGEQALEIVEVLVRSGAVEVVVVDSVAALVPKAEIEGEMGDHHMALQARLMSQALRKLTSHLSKSKTLLIFINQIRHKVGVVFGSPEVTSGGNALKFYASQRLEIRKVGPIKVGDELIGNRVKVKVVKNKLAPPFREAEFDLEFGTGISKTGELIDLGLHYNILQKSGAWISYKGEQLGQGREKTKESLKMKPELAKEICDEIIKTVKEKTPSLEEQVVETELEEIDLDHMPTAAL